MAEEEIMSKTLIMILGAGATGKTTLSRTLAGNDAQEQRIELSVTERGVRKQVKAPYVLGSEIAIAGNLKNTSDAIGAMDALHQTIDHCWKQRDVVIMDGFRCTNKLVRWVEEHPLKPAALFVYIELSLNENLARLRSRRTGNGKIEAKLPPKTFLNVLSFRERALGVWNYAQDHYKRQPVRYLEIPEGMGPEDSAKLVESVLREVQQPGRRFATNHTDSPLSPREQFIQYYVAKQRVGDVDPTHHVITDIFETRKVSKEQQLWVAFLYATLYSPHRFMITWSKFPELRGVDPKAFREWEKVMYRGLGLDPDRIHFMRPPTLTDIFAAYKKALGDKTQEAFFNELIGTDPVASFHTITNCLRSINNVGRHTAYAWTEILIRCVKFPIQCDTIFVKEANSPRKGLLVALEVNDSDPRAKDYAWLDEQVNGLIREIRGRYPTITVDHHYMETVLCQFKNFVNGKRKVGYYLDEQAGNFVRGALVAPEINWREIWELRAKHTTEEHLWEYRDPSHLLESPGFVDACTHTWLGKRDSKARVASYLKELASFLPPVARGDASSRRIDALPQRQSLVLA
ncbi:MAG: AAA family ATPase [Acidobacteriia bacterium]|nr:AAA family ATPase [Terriglobia bacterium]